MEDSKPLTLISDITEILNEIDTKLNTIKEKDIDSYVQIEEVQKQIYRLSSDINQYCVDDKNQLSSGNDPYKKLYRVPENIINYFNNFLHDLIGHGNNTICIQLSQHFEILTKQVKLIHTLKPFYSSSKVVLIGANGSGKSRFSREVQKADLGNIIVIPAQIFLFITEDKAKWISQYNTNCEENFKKFNISADKTKIRNANVIYNTDIPELYLLAFQNILILLLKDYVYTAAKEKYKGSDKEETKLQKVIKFYKEILPHITLDIKLDKDLYEMIVYRNNKDTPYHFNHLSDGEKVVFYYISSIILADENSYIIIDEPENHLNLSIINKLWDMLERERADCNFMYLTHNPNFTISRTEADIFWIQEYTGSEFIYQNITKKNDDNDDFDFPQALLIELLGNRKTIIFCEGDSNNSFDRQLYSKLFPNCYVKPVGSCGDVIQICKAYQKYIFPEISTQQYCGIIDKDFREDKDIDDLKKSNIFCINVACIENILCDESVICKALDRYNHLTKQEQQLERIDKIKEEVFESINKNLYNKFLVKNIKQNIRNTVNQQLNKIDKKESIPNIQIDVDSIKKMLENKINKIIQDKDYEALLSIYNHDSLFNKVCSNLQCNYKTNVINLISEHEDLIQRIKEKYFPCELRSL